MRKTTKKFTSLLLTLCLFVSFMAGGLTPVFAAETASQPEDSSITTESAPSSSSETEPITTPAPDASVPANSTPEASLPQSLPAAASEAQQPPEPEAQSTLPEEAPQADVQAAFTAAQLLATAETDGAKAAEMVNALVDAESYIVYVERILNLYYTRELHEQLSAFTAVLDSRGTETLARYAAAYEERQGSSGAGIVPGQVLVEFVPALAESAAADVLNSIGGSSILSVDNLADGLVVLAQTPLDMTVQQTIDSLQANHSVVVAQPNLRYALPQTSTDEPSALHTASFVATDTYVDEQWYLDAINLKPAWDTVDLLPASQNSPVLVSVIDDGVSYTHPDFAGNLNTSLCTSFSNGIQSVPLTNSFSGHGTHVAGTIAARSNNGQYVAGVATGSDNRASQLMYVNVFTQYFSTKTFQYEYGASSFDILRGLAHSRDKGARVINLSLGSLAEMYQYSGYDFMVADMINQLANTGVVVVAAAGNENTSAGSFPADVEGAISVIALDENSQKATFSNYGSKTDISAPGVDIANLDGSISKANTASYKSGTSMASPIVAGVVALMLYVNPALTAADVKQILYATATDLATPGYDVYTANGLIDAGRAVATASATVKVILSNTSATLAVGKSLQLTSRVMPAHAPQATTYTSSSPSVASVSASGLILARKAGTTTITVLAGSGSSTCKITVIPNVVSVKMAQKSVMLVRGKTITLGVVAKTSTGGTAKVTWTSNNKSVATVVSTSGKITAKKVGSATITATAQNGKKTILTVKVVAKPVTLKSAAIQGAPKTLKVGKTKALTARLSPTSATGAKVTWKSSASTVLAVDGSGTLTAKKTGTATITLTVNGKKATCKIKVIK